MASGSADCLEEQTEALGRWDAILFPRWEGLDLMSDDQK